MHLCPFLGPGILEGCPCEKHFFKVVVQKISEAFGSKAEDIARRAEEEKEQKEAHEKSCIDVGDEEDSLLYSPI